MSNINKLCTWCKHPVDKHLSGSDRDCQVDNCNCSTWDKARKKEILVAVKYQEKAKLNSFGYWHTKLVEINLVDVIKKELERRFSKNDIRVTEIYKKFEAN